MILYFVIIIFFLLLTITADSKQNRAIPFFSFLVLFIVSAFRKETVGGDLKRYLPTFDRVQHTNWGDLLTWNDSQFSFFSEYGFRYLQKVMSCIDGSNQFYIIFTSFFVIGTAMYAINKFSVDKALSVLVYVSIAYLNSFNIIRASLCISICLLSFQYIKERQLLRFLIMMAIAISIQRTSIFFIPAYSLYNLKFNNRLIIIGIVCSLTASMVLTGSGFANFVNTYFTIFEISDESYLISDASTGLTSLALFLLFATFFSLYIYKKNKNEDKDMEFFIYVLVIATIIQFFSSVFMLLNRISLFYYSYLVFFIPYMLKKYKKRNGMIFFKINTWREDKFERSVANGTETVFVTLRFCVVRKQLKATLKPNAAGVQLPPHYYRNG